MIKIALGQMETIPGRPDLNTQAMLAMMDQATARGADLIIFPEMAIPGYLLGDGWEQTAFLRDCQDYGQAIIDASSHIAVMFGNVAVDWSKTGDDGRVRKYNACFTATGRHLVGGENFPYPFRIKTLHPNYREFDDSRHFFSLRKVAAELGTGVDKLLQPVTLTLGGKPFTIAPIICEDGWGDDYGLNPLTVLTTRHHPDLIVNISCSPFTAGKNNKRNRVFSAQAAQAGIPLLYVNTVGLQNNGKTVYTFDGSSTAYDSQGGIGITCPPFASHLEIVYYDSLTASSTGAEPKKAGTDEHPMAGIFQALAYGIRKFLASIGMKQVVIGVSGGIDSSVAAALYAHVLGPENVLLANLPTRYNSDTTKNIAASLAANLRCPYVVVPIEDTVTATVTQLTSSPVTMPDGTTQYLTITPFMTENIQARDRSSRVLAGLAAATGGGFTCNANKSELTVGYATLYGDQAGFLAALADLWKHQVYDLAYYLNETVYGREVIPQESIDIVPSAELSFDQAVDEGKGDPLVYPYHDYLFRSFVEHWQRATPEDILSWYQQGVLEEKIGCQPGLIETLFPTAAAFVADLERWWKQYTGLGVAKRIQAPPVLAVSRRAYGFDHREAQNGVYFTRRYHVLKSELLGGNVHV